MDLTYIIFVVPALLLSLIASSLVSSRFSKFDKVKSKKNITGAQAAQLLLQANNINDVKIQHIAGKLTDNYDPTKKVLSLSDSTYSSSSIAAVGVAAHETGHAIQHARGYVPIKIRSHLVPIANIGSQFGPILIMIGLGLFAGQAALSSYAPLIVNLGIGLFCGAVAFYLITLPVEFNASSRALKILKSSNTLDDEELKGVRKVLSAAALTYVGSALNAIGNLLRILVLSKNTRRRNY